MCKITDCKRPTRARGMCNAHYNAWWLKQPKSTRHKGKGGRKKSKSVRYDGMLSRVLRESGQPNKKKCVDCGKKAKAWTWNQSCKKVLWDDSGTNAIHLTPYCLHEEHYEPRCHPCRVSRRFWATA